MDNTVSVVLNDSPDYLLNKLLEWAGIVMNLVWPPGNQQVEIENDWVLDITSVDGSIVITSLNGVWDLSWCCLDKYVKVSANDTTASYLVDKLKTEVGWPLHLTINNSWANEYYELSLNESELIITDELVAVQAWCPADYLEDIIISWDGIIVESIIGTPCELKISIDDTDEIWKRPCCRRTLSRTFEITGIPNGTTEIEAVIDLWNPYYGLNDVTNDVDMLITDDVVTITKTGMYKVFMKGTCEINKGIAAFRVYLVCSSWSWSTPLDVRYWGPTTTGDYVTWNALSLWARVQRWNVSSFNILNLDAWSFVGVVVKASAEVDGSVEPQNAVNGKIKLLATWDVVEDHWFSFGVEYVWNII